MTEMNTAEIMGNGLQLSGTDYKPTAAIEAMKRIRLRRNVALPI